MFGMRILPATLETMLGCGQISVWLLGSGRGSSAYSASAGISDGMSISINSPGQIVVVLGGARIT